MYNVIKELIEKYSKIIVHRHYNPDGDALGSQLGMKRIIELNYPDKEVYAVGDENVFQYLGKMDTISDDKYEGALAIILDVSVERLVSDDRYKLADHVLVIDHHLNPSDIADTEFNDSSQIACAQIVADFAISNDMKLDELAATPLFAGITTDSGRFKYPLTDAKTFEIVAHLIKCGADMHFVYDKLYTEELNFKKLRGYFINNFNVFKEAVAFMKNDNDVKEAFNVNTFTVSRAMVNQMADIEGIQIWANFTRDDNEEILVELRSKRLSIVDVAKKYGGGGHALACGCTLKSFEEADLVLADLYEVIERSNTNG